MVGCQMQGPNESCRSFDTNDLFNLQKDKKDGNQDDKSNSSDLRHSYLVHDLRPVEHWTGCCRIAGEGIRFPNLEASDYDHDQALKYSNKSKHGLGTSGFD